MEELRRGVVIGNEALWNGVMDCIPDAGGRGVNTRTLRRSIQPQETRIDFAGHKIEGATGTPIITAPLIEDGRKPGPVSPEGQLSIGLWAVRKLGLDIRRTKSDLDQATQLRRAAYPIVRKIRERGFDGVHMFARGAKRAESAIRAALDAAAERARRVWNGGA
jgi:hypothetical protein